MKGTRPSTTTRLDVSQRVSLGCRSLRRSKIPMSLAEAKLLPKTTNCVNL